MNKKTIIKLAIITIISALVGAIISMGLIKTNFSGLIDFTNTLSILGKKHSLYFYLILIISTFLPAIYLFFKGKSILNSIDYNDENAVDTLEKKGKKLLDIAVTLNGLFIILNLMIFGLTFSHKTNYTFVIILIFLLSSISGSVLDIIIIKYIQSIDNRLKGDPTSLSFQKDFIKSCDEAEKIKIYKASYKSFQLLKNISLALLVIGIMLKIVLKTGATLIIFPGLFVLLEISLFSYYSMKSEN